MFDDVTLTKHITANYSLFTNETLIEKKPIENWPKLFGEKAASIIKQNYGKNTQKTKVLIVYGGVGRSTLEILRHCENLEIDHTDASTNNLQVLQLLLQESRIQWCQQIEGKIFESMDYSLDSNEKQGGLLSNKKNTISFWQADYKNLCPQLDQYNVIVADFRYQNAADELLHISTRLTTGGLLLLGSIDDVNEEVQYKNKHSLVVLKKYFNPVIEVSREEYPHINRETRYEHQYAISHFSAWKKNSDEAQLQKNPIETGANVKLSTAEYYETKDILSSYTLFHFGPGLLSIKNFPLRMAEVCVEACKKFNNAFKLALDAGCGPGRTAIELCSNFEKVEAYDYSKGFVEILLEQKKKRRLTNLTAFQGDCHKQEEICHEKKFDLISGSNLIDRLHSPEKWLFQCKRMLTPGGLLIVTSPYTWMPEHTSPKKWIGGFKKNGEDHFTVDGLKALLEPELFLLEEFQVPFVIPDADGTYQYTYSNCTIFGGRS